MIPMRPDPMPEGSKPVDIGAGQSEYHTLPAATCDVFADDGKITIPNGLVITEWELSAEELNRVCRGARIRVSILTFGGTLQPLRVEVAKETTL